MKEQRLIDANALMEGRVNNDPVVIAAKCAPTVEPKRGEWIMCWGRATWKCSECGYYERRQKKQNYCSNCGAKMKG